jgi:endonuclease G
MLPSFYELEATSKRERTPVLPLAEHTDAMSLPKPVVAAIHQRIAAAREERSESIKSIQTGQPLHAEPDAKRVISRIQAATGLSQNQAEQLAQGTPAAALGLSGERRLSAERIQGLTTDFVSVAFLDLARAAARCVARVVSRDLQPIGSGFMISERLFLTNNHVLPDQANAREMLIEFDYEVGFDHRPRPVTRFAFDADTFFLTSSENDLDFTLIAVGKRENGTGKLNDFGFCPLMNTSDKHILGEFVNIIQHPEGDYKQIVLRENRLVTRLERVLHYIADTQPGSSGSPVFNDQWEAVALHHWGEPFTEQQTPDGQPVTREVNEGIRISAIVAEALTQGETLPAKQQKLLDQALDVRFRQPSTIGRAEQQLNIATIAPVTDTAPPPDEPVPSMAQPTVNAGIATWTIPLQVSVRLGDLPGVTTSGQASPAISDDTALPTTPEKVRVDPNYGNRRGYDPAFLTGFKVDPPKLSAAQRKLAARKLTIATNEDPYELKYQHFSLVMHATRRLAFWTAVNIDGATLITINRKTGRPGGEDTDAAEASEQWSIDPRIAKEAQSDQSLYDQQRPKRLFDRGHLVRRQDPNWGTPGRAMRANADTFHFTNCSPQESQFNQQARYWQGIEAYVLDNARAEREKLSVFTGPVLGSSDPAYRYVNVPLAFWKVVVRVEHGKLVATALLADQSARLRRLPERLADDADLSEDFADLGPVAEYHIAIRKLEQLTGLSFGRLREADTFRSGPERADEQRALGSFEEIALDLPALRKPTR